MVKQDFVLNTKFRLKHQSFLNWYKKKRKFCLKFKISVKSQSLGFKNGCRKKLNFSSNLKFLLKNWIFHTAVCNFKTLKRGAKLDELKDLANELLDFLDNESEWTDVQGQMENLLTLSLIIFETLAKYTQKVSHQINILLFQQIVPKFKFKKQNKFLNDCPK